MSIALYNRNVMPTLFREFFNDAGYGHHLTSGTRRCFTPAVDIMEQNDTLTFTFELPGVKKEDIKLEVKDGVLSMTGEKPAVETDEENVRYFSRERCSGTFGRSFRIGNAYDPSTVTAKYDNGLLTVSLTKREEAKPVSIQVQ